MKVAIIGAGLAGLACAHELERYAVNATIIERNSFIGEAFSHVGAVLEVISRPTSKPLDYFKYNLGIDVKPIHTVKKVIHHSPNKTTVIGGNLGYFFERSKEPMDVKVQIFSKLKKTKIIYNTFGDYEKLAQEYDYVVIANGNPDYTNELGCWIPWVNTFVKGATVLGNFDAGTLMVWLNKDYCKNGYVYLTPFDSTRASLVLVATDVTEKEIDHFWELFLYSEKITYTIVEEFKISHKSGYVYPHKVNNIYFAGNAGGSIDPFLGFGVANSLISGVMSARSIVNNTDYEKLLSKVVQRNCELLNLRKGFNGLDNASYDKLVTLIGMPVIKQLTYYTPINIIKHGSQIIALKNMFVHKNK